MMVWGPLLLGNPHKWLGFSTRRIWKMFSFLGVTWVVWIDWRQNVMGNGINLSKDPNWNEDPLFIWQILFWNSFGGLPTSSFLRVKKKHDWEADHLSIETHGDLGIPHFQNPPKHHLKLAIWYIGMIWYMYTHTHISVYIYIYICMYVNVKYFEMHTFIKCMYPIPPFEALGHTACPFQRKLHQHSQVINRTRAYPSMTNWKNCGRTSTVPRQSCCRRTGAGRPLPM